MPLGDSITRGDPGIVGYRQRLYLNLIDNGYDVDFVGSVNTGSSASPSFDADHEGHGGYTSGQVATNVYGWLVAHPAKVVLLHIGTNDLNPPLDPITLAANVENILDEIDRYSPEVTVVLARIIDTQSHDPNVQLYNSNVVAMAENRIANGDKIIIVDQESALNYATDMADNLHPNASGYNKMADVWLPALESFLPKCDINITDSISPADDLQMDFGSIVKSFSSAQEIVTISNTGNSDLSVSNIQLTGTNPGEFTLDVNGGTTPCAGTAFTISAGDNCTIGITFSPTTAGSMSANLEITSGDPDESSVIVALSGTGTEPDINVTDSISPNDDLQMDFGTIVESFSSGPEIVTISNTGSSDLSVSNIQLTGTNPGEYTLDVNGGTTPCAGTAFNIPAGDNCTIGITFSPTMAGSMSANIEITSDDPDESSVIVALSGTGVLPPDLVVKVVSDPPVARRLGTSFYIKAKVKNQGVGAAYKKFTVRHYLSKNRGKLINEEADILLTGDVFVLSLAAGVSSTRATQVYIGTDTPLGKYYVKVCADSGNDLMESNENNNCRASLTKIRIKP
jgi:lysophospholipase L1-like esterase